MRRWVPFLWLLVGVAVLTRLTHGPPAEFLGTEPAVFPAPTAPAQGPSRLYRFEVGSFGAHHRFSAQGRYLVSQLREQVEIREALTGRLIRTLAGTNLVDARVAEDRVLLENSQSNPRTRQVAVFDLKSGQKLFGPYPTDGTNPLLASQLSGDGHYLALITRSEITVRDLRSGQGWKLEDGDGGSSGVLAFGSDHLLLAATAAHWTVWDLSTRTVRLRVTQPASAARFSPDGKTLVVSGRQTEFWDLAGARLVGTWPNPSRAIAFSPDGQTLALSPGPTRFKDRNGWRDTGKLSLLRVGSWQPVLRDFPSDGFEPAFSGDSRTLLVTRNAKERDEPIELWVSLLTVDGRVATGRYYAEGRSAWMGPQGHVLVETFSPDASSYWNELFAPGLRRQLARLTGGTAGFHPREELFWIQSGRSVEVWNVNP